MKAILEGRTLAYTVQANPGNGRFLYSSVFIKRRKVMHDRVDFDEVREMLIKLNKNKSSYENKRSSSSNDDKDSNDEYIDENIYKSSNKFGNDFDDHYYHNCDGCLEAAVIQYLLRNRTWTYSRLAIDGLKSVVFHNPSPTWCIASANIWFDIPDYEKTGCLRRNVVYDMLFKENEYRMFDWTQFRLLQHVCLRLSPLGFKQIDSLNLS